MGITVVLSLMVFRCGYDKKSMILLYIFSILKGIDELATSLSNLNFVKCNQNCLQFLNRFYCEYLYFLI